MNTWTFKPALAAVLAFALVGCEDGFAIPGATGSQALRMAELGSGTVMLVPPDGFCIDKRSLRQSFALMARCDTLGGDASVDAPLALITATTLSASTEVLVRAQDLGAEAETVLLQEDRGAVSLVQVQGEPPNPSLRDTYWRAAARVGGEIVGLAIYEGQDRKMLGQTAPRLLEETIMRTQNQTGTVNPDNSATTSNIPEDTSMVSGLSE